MLKYIQQFLGHIFLLLGVIGIFLPIMPTTPFLLLATFFYSRSHPKIYQYILNHKYLGPPIRDWESKGVIRPKAKIFAISMIAIIMTIQIPLLNINFYIKILAEVTLFILTIFIFTRPSN
jgi:uncharacterized membrane protein YbaN (DUF454 family)